MTPIILLRSHGELPDDIDMDPMKPALYVHYGEGVVLCEVRMKEVGRWTYKVQLEESEGTSYSLNADEAKRRMAKQLRRIADELENVALK